MIRVDLTWKGDKLEMKHCPNPHCSYHHGAGNFIPEEANYCPEDGQLLETYEPPARRCGVCNYITISNRAAFCVKCGSSLANAEEIPRQAIEEALAKQSQ